MPSQMQKTVTTTANDRKLKRRQLGDSVLRRGVRFDGRHTVEISYGIRFQPLNLCRTTSSDWPRSIGYISATLVRAAQKISHPYAASAHSLPLFPMPPPARWMACSTVSQVRMPNRTGSL